MDYTHTFRGLTANQINELIEEFGEACHHWDKVSGFAKVDFPTEEEFHTFIQTWEFAND